MSRRISRSPAATAIAATLISGGGGVALFDAVMGEVIDQQAAHIQTLERALQDCSRVSDRCDVRLENAQDALAEMRARGCSHG